MDSHYSFTYPSPFSDLVGKKQTRETHLEHFETMVLVWVLGQMTRLHLAFSPRRCEQFDLSDYTFTESPHNRESDSDSYEKWLHLVRLMAHISLYRG